MRTRIKCTIATAALSALTACGGGGGDNETPPPAGAPGTDTGTVVAPVSGKFVGTFSSSQMPQGSVELLAANGATRTAPFNAQGQFEFGLEGLEAPLLLRGRSVSGEATHAAISRLPAHGDIVNINALTQLVAATMAPEGNATKLWDLPATERASRIRSNRDTTTAQISTAVAPVISALQLPATTDFASQAAGGSTSPVGTLLDSLQINAYAVGNSTAFSMAAARTPALRSVWAANDQAVPVVPLSSQYPPKATAPARAVIEASYANTRQGAAQFDPAKMNQAEVTRILQEFQNLAANPSTSTSQVMALYRSFMLAMGFPSAFADEVVQQMRGTTPEEGLQTMLSYFGPQGQQAMRDLSNMQVSLVSSDPASQLATYQVLLGGQTYYQTWSLASGSSVTGRTTQRDYAQQCIKEQYVGPRGPSQSISAAQFVDNLEAYNACDFPIHFASCVWRSGTTGPQNSGCSDNVAMGTARPQESTYLRAVRSGPLYDQRVFVACRSPAKPVHQGSAVMQLSPFALEWQCVG